MKVCQIVPSLEARYGGPSRSVLSLSRALSREGHDVELLATEPGPGYAEVDGRLQTRVFHRDWPQAFCPSAGLRSAVLASDAAVVHHHSIWLRTLHYAHLRARQRATKFVLSPRGMMSRWAWHHRGWRKKFSLACIHPGALHAVQGWHATSFEEEADIRGLGFKQPVCVAPNGVDAPDPADLVAARARWLQLCPAIADRPVALFYSRFHRKKRVLELIDLWLARGPANWLLLLVGIPEDYTPDLLENYVMHNSGGGRVSAFNGVDEPPPYAIASLFLLPSHSENFGLVIAEAMAHGVPALVTDSTPWHALNTDGRGWCVPWEKYPEALRAATDSGVSRLREQGAHAQQWVLREYAWERSARTLGDFYTHLQ